MMRQVFKKLAASQLNLPASLMVDKRLPTNSNPTAVLAQSNFGLVKGNWLMQIPTPCRPDEVTWHTAPVA